MPRLIAQSGHSMDLPPRKISLGTGPACDVRLADGFGLGSAHFEIVPGSPGYRLRDLGSGLGTWLNGQPVGETEVRHGDVISAGILRLTFWLEEAPAEAKPVPTAAPAPAVSPRQMTAPVPAPAAARQVTAPVPAPATARQVTAPVPAPAATPRAAAPAKPAVPSGFPSLPTAAVPKPGAFPAAAQSPAPAAQAPAAAPAMPAPAVIPAMAAPVTPPAAPVTPPAAPVTPPAAPVTPPAAAPAMPFGSGMASAPAFTLAPAAPQPMAAMPQPAPAAPPVPAQPPVVMPPSPVSPQFAMPPAGATPGAALSSAPLVNEAPLRSPTPPGIAVPAARPGMMPPAGLPPPGIGGPPMPWPVGAETVPVIPAVSTESFPPADPAAQPSTETAKSNPIVVKPRRKSRPLRRALIAGVATTASLAAACAVLWASSEEVRGRAQVFWQSFQAWLEPKHNPPPPSTVTTTASREELASRPVPMIASPDILPQAAHSDVVKQMLTPATESLFSVDLKQLIPFYNTVLKELRELPERSEMAGAFKRYYGVQMDDFDRITTLQSKEKDDFVMVLSAGRKVDLRGMLDLGPEVPVPQPPREETEDGRPARPVIPVHTYEVSGKRFAAAQLDPFTVVVGKPEWVRQGVLRGMPAEAHEALCMYPETAMQNPGALVVVERLGRRSSDRDGVLPYETTILNLFLNSKGGGSRLMVTANPEVKPADFVQRCVNDLKQESLRRAKQARELIPDLPGSKPVAAAQAPEEPEVHATEASISLPDGERMIMTVVDHVARSFMARSPSIELILQAQAAINFFNTARLNGAADALSCDTTTAALERLSNGIRGGNASIGGKIAMPGLTDERIHQMSTLLELDPKVGLVFRPNFDILDGSTRDLALKARNYRNAELLSSGWKEGGLGPVQGSDVLTACRQVLAWASTRAGAGFRLGFGLPELTEDELIGASALLNIEKGHLVWRKGETDFRTWVRQLKPETKKSEAAQGRSIATDR